MSISTRRAFASASTGWKYGAAITTIACLTSWQTPAWSQSASVMNLNTSISSDGSSKAAESAGTSVAASNRGSGRSLAAGEVDDGNANIPARAETPAAFARLLALRPATAPTGIESIIGVDSRTLVNPTTTYPARATVLITFTTPSGGSRCTGWLIGKDTVATAGHCVSSGGSGTFYNRTSYRIYAGRNGASAPYGTCTATRLSSVTGWVNSGLEEYDYGAIKLLCNVGTTTGWYGFFWQAASLTGLPVITQGYPGDKPLTQWRSTDLVRATTTRQVFYRADTVGGQSGSPVWYNRSATCNPCSMAIHAYGLHGAAPHNANNHGTRIIQAVFNNLVFWKNQAK